MEQWRNKKALDGWVAADPDGIVAYVSERAAGQAAWKERLAAAGWAQRHRALRAEAVRVGAAPRLGPPTNILGIGPTGCGKTYISSLSMDAIGVPSVLVDCTTLTGNTQGDRPPASIVWDMLRAVNNDVAAAETGVIVLDEVDKLHQRPLVQQELLRIVEGHALPVRIAGRDTVVQTNQMLFIACGAFTGLTNIIRRHAREAAASESATVREFLRRTAAGPLQPPRDISAEEVAQFGLLYELVARLPDVVVLDPLLTPDLYEVLSKAESCLWTLQRVCLEGGIDVQVPDGTRWAIAERAASLGIGARGLARVLAPVRQYMESSVARLCRAGVHAVRVLPEHLESGVPEPIPGADAVAPSDFAAMVDASLDDDARWLRDRFPPGTLPTRFPRLAGPHLARFSDLADVLAHDVELAGKSRGKAA